MKHFVTARYRREQKLRALLATKEQEAELADGELLVARQKLRQSEAKLAASEAELRSMLDEEVAECAERVRDRIYRDIEDTHPRVAEMKADGRMKLGDALAAAITKHPRVYLGDPCPLDGGEYERAVVMMMSLNQAPTGGERAHFIQLVADAACKRLGKNPLAPKPISQMTRAELQAERARQDAQVAKINTELAAIDQGWGPWLEVLVEEGARRVIDRVAAIGSVEVNENTRRALDLHESGMDGNAALLLAAIERAPDAYLGDLLAEHRLKGIAAAREIDDAAAKMAFMRLVAERAAPQLEDIEGWDVLPKGDHLRSLTDAQLAAEFQRLRALRPTAHEEITLNLHGMLAACAEKDARELLHELRVTGSPIQKVFAEHGLTPTTETLTAALVADPDRFGSDGWQHLVDAGWKNASQATIRETYARTVAKIAGERWATMDDTANRVRDELVKVPAGEREDLLRDVGKELGVSPAKTEAMLLNGRYQTTKDVWTDATMTEAGVRIWQDTYKTGADDALARKHCEAVASQWAAFAADRGPLRARIVEQLLFFSGKWAIHAFQRITTSHTYGAALMCTDADRDSLETIEAQWHAFMVQVPNGLLQVDKGLEYNRVLVTMYQGGASLIVLDTEHSHPARVVVETSGNLADLLFDAPTTELTPPVVDAEHARLRDDAKVLIEKLSGPQLHHLVENTVLEGALFPEAARAIVLAKRLVAGLLLAMQHADNFRSKTYPAREKRRDGRLLEEPEHRVVLVGKPISVDCRKNVADFIVHGPRKKGRHGPQTVQVLVRGHFRRQVVGVGRTGRKVIWVAPFWRGPDDAPIFTHPKHVGGAE